MSSVTNSLLSSTATTTPAVNISSLLAAAAGVSTPGIDVNAAVAAALYADRASERIWQAQQATLAAQTTALTAMQTATTAISTDMQSLNSLTGPLSARAVESSDTTVVTATAASGTVAGNHTVVVNSLASTGAWYSDLEPSPTTPLPVESFTIKTTSGASAIISTGSGVNTLADIASSINSQTNLGLTATVVSDSSGARLAILSNTSGSAADFTIASAPTTTTSWSSPSIPAGSTLGANSFTIAQGGATATITSTADESLADLATSINTQVPGVTASVVSDAQGSHLTIDSNSATPFTISEPAAGLVGFTQAVVGQNASLNVDGIPISSASNTVTGAIGGVTLSLLNTTSQGSDVNLSVGTDASQVSTAIQTFVSDYNTAVGMVNSSFSYDATTGAQGVLGSDPTVRNLQDTLLAAISYTNGSTTSTVTTLGSLGITTNEDGTLAIDTATLDNAVSNAPLDVQNFFQGASLNGFANTLSTQLGNFNDPSTGAFSVDLKSISNENQDLTTQISDFESNYIASQQTTLTAMYSAAEIALQQLPTQMAQLQAELGNNPSSSNG